MTPVIAHNLACFWKKIVYGGNQDNLRPHHTHSYGESCIQER